MLYALLVEGSGPLGSVFSRDEFTDREVKDTDGDGLPEFVDAWGEPLQFFRWPFLYHSDLQRGQVITATSQQVQDARPNPTTVVWEEREQNPLDPNQQLLAPGWWYSSYQRRAFANNNFPAWLTSPASPARAGRRASVRQAFEYYFHRLTEPLQITAARRTAWDRSGGYRRAFYSKFLIVSSGPDKQLGLFLYADATLLGLSTNPRRPSDLQREQRDAVRVRISRLERPHVPSGSGRSIIVSRAPTATTSSRTARTTSATTTSSPAWEGLSMTLRRVWL